MDGARETYPFEISTLCSIHVATARAISSEVDDLQFWTHLPQQALAAISRGLDVRGSVIKS